MTTPESALMQTEMACLNLTNLTPRQAVRRVVGRRFGKAIWVRARGWKFMVLKIEAVSTFMLFFKKIPLDTPQ